MRMVVVMGMVEVMMKRVMMKDRTASAVVVGIVCRHGRG